MLCRTTFQAVGWRPSIGSRLCGKLVHSVQSHASLIINSTFNASIAADHLPPDKYHYDSHAVDPHSELDSHLIMDDFYAEQWLEADKEQLAHRDKHESEDVAMLAALPHTREERDVSLGCWVNKKSRKALGDNDGMLIFTVIGLTMANGTISVHGSLLDDPFAIPLSKLLPAMPTPSISQQQSIRAEFSRQPVTAEAPDDAVAETGNDANDPDSNFAIDHGRTGQLHEKDTVSKKRRRKDLANDTTANDAVQPLQTDPILKPVEPRAKPIKKPDKKKAKHSKP